MVTSTQLYLITQCDHVREGLGFIMAAFVACGFAVLVALLITTFALDEKHESDRMVSLRRAQRKFLFFTFLTLLAFSLTAFVRQFIPTTSEMAAILVLPRIINNEKVQELPGNVLDLANEWIKEQTEHLKGDETKE